MSAPRGRRAVRLFVMVTLCAATAFTAASCIAVGGTEKHAYPTLGRQLSDLKLAHENGAINDQEYATAKHHLLHGK